VCTGEFVATNSALEEVYGILRGSYADVVETEKRNDSELDRKNYDGDRDEVDDDDVWRILDFEKDSRQSFHRQSNLI